MWLLTLILLVLLGLLGISDWLKAKRPDIARHLQPSGDVRGLVDQLASRYGSTLQPGEHVALR